MWSHNIMRPVCYINQRGGPETEQNLFIQTEWFWVRDSEDVSSNKAPGLPYLGTYVGPNCYYDFLCLEHGNMSVVPLPQSNRKSTRRLWPKIQAQYERVRNTNQPTYC